jgi:hypothetical protein
MTQETIDTLTALAAIVTPLLLLALGDMGWLLKHSIERAQAQHIDQLSRVRELDDNMRSDRIATYNALLEPFFLLFTTEAAFSQDKAYKGKNKIELATSLMLSVEYRRIGFKLSLIANDDVVRAYNKLMQYFYQNEGSQAPLEVQTSTWIRLLGDLLLAIRRSMGNETTSLDRWEMIEWFMKDANLMKNLARD